MRRRTYLRAIGVAGTGVLAGCSADESPTEDMSETDTTAERPNVLLILIDQLRAAALGCYGDPNVYTPHFDRVARHGLRFENAIVPDPTCSPTRAALLTGRMPMATGVIGNGETLPPAERSLADALADAGYRTGYIGKWHLGPSEEERPSGYDGSPTYVPPRYRTGFEWWRASPGKPLGATVHHGHATYDTDGSVDWIRTDDWQPTIHTDMAIERIERWRKRHPTDPWFLQLNYLPPHPPFVAPDDLLARYDPDTFTLRPNVPAADAAQARRWLHAYYANITGIDREIGRLLNSLSQHLAHNTIVVITADHGGMVRSHGLRGKNVPYEESIHVPLIVRYPARLVERDSPVHTMISTIDIAPTIAGFCRTTDIPVRLGRPDRPVHGNNLATWLTASEYGGADAQGQRSGAEHVYIAGLIPQDHSWRAIRWRNWMLAIDGDRQTTHCYYLRDDPYQQHNLAGGIDLPDIHPEHLSDTEDTLRDQLFVLMDEYDDRQFLARR